MVLRQPALIFALVGVLAMYATCLSWHPTKADKRLAMHAIQVSSMSCAMLVFAYFTFRLLFWFRELDFGILFAIIPAFCGVTMIMEIPGFLSTHRAWIEDKKVRQRKIDEAKRKALSTHQDNNDNELPPT